MCLRAAGALSGDSPYDGGALGRFRHGGDGRNLHEVEKHQASMQLPGSRDVAILLFLFLGTEHEIKTVVAIVADWDVFVVGVYDEITASRFVVLVNEPALDAVHQLCSDVLARKLAVYAETTDQDRRVDQVALLLGDVSADSLSSGVGKMVGEDARVGYRKGTDDFVRIVDFEKGIGLSHQLFRVIKIIRCEEFVEVFVSAAERRASGNNLRGEWYAGAPIV